MNEPICRGVQIPALTFRSVFELLAREPHQYGNQPHVGLYPPTRNLHSDLITHRKKK
jgi:hypothetical protein